MLGRAVRKRKYKSMKEAVVIGGSNGIGLGITNSLIEKGYYVHILDMQVPDEEYLVDKTKYRHQYIDLMDLRLSELSHLKHNPSIDTLAITAGFGRVAHFASLSSKEIESLLQVNSLATIQILHYFYDRMVAEELFKTAVMVSIAGHISSPLFSVYGASKAALHHLIESVNVELEMVGSTNRILEVSPGKIPGTRYYGASHTDIHLVYKLAQEILKHLEQNETLFIPEFEEVYQSVLERYHADPAQFGRESYRYKMDSGRVLDEKKKIVVGYLSGTFDLFHIGHLKLLKRAKQQCDYLIVGVHADASHKGKETFISFEERLEIVRACKYVDHATQSTKEDSESWEKFHFDKLFVGSDYKGTERFNHYEKVLGEKGVEIVYFPYTKGTSSSQLREILTRK